MLSHGGSGEREWCDVEQEIKELEDRVADLESVSRSNALALQSLTSKIDSLSLKALLAIGTLAAGILLRVAGVDIGALSP